MLIKRLFQPSAKARTNYNGLTWTLINGQFVIDDDNSNVYIEKGYKALPNLYGIISLITSKTSIVPHEVFRVKDQAKYRKYRAMMKGASTTRDYAKAMSMKVQSMEKVENSPLDELLSNPNPLQSAQEFNESLDGYLLLTGNAYMYGLELGSQVKELHSLIAPSVVIKTGDSFLDPVQGYSLSYMQEPIPKDQIGHIKYWNPVGKYQKVEDIVYGLSPLKSCRTLLGKYREADIAQGAMFKNMGVNGILSGDNEMTQEQAVALKDRWKQLYGGAAKAGDIAVTSANVKWNQIGLSPVDLNIIEGKEEILGELCNVYHTPIGLFTKTNSTENNMVEGRKMFITDAVIPNVERRKNVINKWLAPKFGPGLIVEYDYSVLSELSEDLDKLADSALKMWWITGNERRQMTNYDVSDDPNMDKFLVPSGLVPLDDIVINPNDIDEQFLNPNNNQ